MTRIAVLVKQVPDTWGDRRIDLASGRVDRTGDEQVLDEINERALEVALQHKDGDKSSEVVAIGMGPDAAMDSLRRALAIGADSAVHIVDDALGGADAVATSAALAAAIRNGGYDLIVAGNVSTDGGGGVVPSMVAERLGIPLISSLDEVEIASGVVSGSRTVDIGVQRLHAQLPAIVTVTERVPEARYPGFKSLMSAKKKPFNRTSVAELDVESAAASSVVIDSAARPPRAAGRVIVDEGQAAAELAEFLSVQRLI